MWEEIYRSIMKKTQYLSLICLLAGSVAAWGQGAAKGSAGSAAKGKTVFDEKCSLCHEATRQTKRWVRG